MASAFKSALEVGSTEAPGTRVGPYRLLEKIGEGGFGTVWMADQLEPIRRRVAVKIIKLGMDTQEVIARFEAERQALALMDHPNIARVFDAGATDSGRPFFVMELVRGVPITRYCDDSRLPAEARLRLFIPVCQAVQHAHQKGVIHRDLKPSNILVTLHDGVPVPKIIDFGIAKATSARLTDKTLFTQFHAFIGTPAYTSPEQMEMSGLDIDTRSDIYSLGVLLYELLCGRPPFDAEALVKLGLEAMRRTIRETDPPRPSARLDALSPVERTTAARQRSTDVAKLSVLLRSDLDWIVMRCLEKDRARRYETASALATDIQHHLADEPVSARPPNAFYRIGKFARRHRTSVAATATVLAALVAGLGFALIGFHRAVVQQRATAAARGQAEGLVVLMTDELTPALEQRGGLPQLVKSAEAAVQYYESLPPDLRSTKTDQAQADALAALGRLRGNSLLDKKGAKEVMKAALKLREKIARDNPNDPEAAVALLEQEFEMPETIGDAVADRSAANREQLVRRGRELHARFPDNLRISHSLVGILNWYVEFIADKRNESHEAAAAATELRILVEQLMAARAREKVPIEWIGGDLNRLSWTLNNAGFFGVAVEPGAGETREQFLAYTNAVEVSKQALAICTEALGLDPGNLKLRFQTAVAAQILSYADWQDVAAEHDTWDDVVAERTAREHFRVLVELSPNDQGFREGYASAHLVESIFQVERAPDFEAGLRANHEYLALLDPIAAKDPSREPWAGGHLGLAAFEASAGKSAEARKEIERAELNVMGYCNGLPENSFERCEARSRYLTQKANVLYCLRDWPMMARVAQDCMAEIEVGLKQAPTRRSLLLYRRAIANAYLAVAAQREGRFADAIALLQPSIAMMRTSSTDSAYNQFSPYLRNAQKALTESLAKHGDLAQAKEAAEKLLLDADFSGNRNLPAQDWAAGAITVAASLCDSAEAVRCIGLTDRVKTMLTSPAAIGRITVDGKENLATIARLQAEAMVSLAPDALERTGRELDAAAATDPDASERFTRNGEATWNLWPHSSALSSPKAREAELAAREGYRALMARYPDNGAYRFLYAATHRMECYVHLGWDGQVEPARAAFRQYDALLEPFVDRKGYGSVWRTRLLNSLHLAQLAASVGDKADTDRWLAEAQRRFEGYRDRLPPHSPNLGLALVQFLEESSWCTWWSHDWPKLAQPPREAQGASDLVLQGRPANDDLLERRAMADGFAALALAGVSPTTEAATPLQAARDRFRIASGFGARNVDLVVWAIEKVLPEALQKSGDLAPARKSSLEVPLAYQKWVDSFPEYWLAQKHQAFARIREARALDPADPYRPARCKELLDQAAATLAQENVAGRLTVDVQEALQEVGRLRAAQGGEPVAQSTGLPSSRP